jgi:hypothetical protein
MLASLLFAAENFNGGFVVTVLIALLLAGLVYWVASLFLPHPVPIIVALLVLVLAFFGTGGLD